MIIVNSSIEDIETIFDLYDDAINYQKKVFNKQWEGFERNLIEIEIAENRQWKIVIDSEIACIFAITYNDVLFWKEKDKQPSIYIHRIVTNSKFRGMASVPVIIDWAKQFCIENHKEFVRLDTWGDNQKLIEYYVRCGFNHVETIDLDKTDGLPIHYKGSLALFEIKI